MFCLGILISEIILIFTSQKAIEKRELKFRKVDKIILCLGDSYTYGGEVENKYSYPFILSTLAEKIGFTAINGGACEADTTTILEKYQYFLQRIRPEKVIFLGGTANFFGYKSPDKLFFENLKTFKLIKIFITDIKAKFIASKAKNGIYSNLIPLEIDLNHNYSENEENFYIKKTLFLLYEQRNFNTAYETIMQGLKKFPDSLNLRWLHIDVSFKMNKIKEAEKEIIFFNSNIEKLKSNAKISKTAVGIIIRGLAEWNLINYNFDEASKKIVESLKYLDYLTPYDVYVIKQSFLMQSSISADKIYKILLDIANSNLILASDKNFNNLIDYFKEFKINEEKRIKWLKSDISKIIEISKKNNVELYIMTYPYPYRKVNDILREIAVKNKIKLIDCERYFMNLNNSKRKKYFKDTDHLTPEGNRYLANIIFKEIF